MPGGPPTFRPERLRSQFLTGPGGSSPEGVVGRILAIQAQDDRGFRLAVRSRSRGLSAQDVDGALNDRQLLVTWLNRGTLHLVRSEDFWWLHPLTAPRSASGINHRLGQLGVSGQQAERGVEVIVGSLHTEGPLVRGDLRDRLDAEGIPTGGQALVHLLAAASLHGLIVRGPVLETGHAFVSVDDWLGKPPPTLQRQEALRRLAMRYLEGHQPAAPGDLAKWAGITLSDARLGFSELADEIRSLGEGFVIRGKRLGRSKAPPTRLLGPFDPLLHGWAAREMWVGAHSSVVTTNGIFRAVVLSDGRVTGTWRRSPDGVLVEPLEAIDEEATAAMLEDAQDLFRFMRWKARSSVISVHFPD